MATLSAADLAALAETLTSTIADVEKTSRNIQQHIDAKAKEIGDARGRTYAKAADERIKAVTDEAAIEIRRRDDVIAELRIQLEIQVRKAERGREAEAALRRIQMLKVWRDNLGRGFVFSDELGHAIDPSRFPAPAPARIP